MRVVTEKEYCDRCGAEIPKYKGDNSTRWFSLHYMTTRIKFFQLPWKCNSEEGICGCTSDERTYKIICSKCAKEFVEWWNEKNVKT